MKSFKNYLREADSFYTRDDIEKYLRKHWAVNFKAGNIKIDPATKEVSGPIFSLTVTEDNLITVAGEKIIPVKFSAVADFQHVNKHTPSFTLEYAPSITENFWAAIDPYFNNVDYFPEYSDLIDISQCVAFKSLHNIHKRVKRTHVLTLCNMIESSMLGTMLVPELGQIEFINFISSGTSNDAIFTLTNVFNKALRNNGDILDVKAELIEQGLSEFAKI
ncbi:MAG: hypothetical protein QXN55_01125 [Candidatus Nitrosotenuis sp.]